MNPGLYVHIPFCASRCRYCAFASSIHESERASRYLEAMKMEARHRGIFPTTAISTLFIGGGTPSVLEPKNLTELFSFLPTLSSSIEATCEANPDSLSPEKIEILLANGINRLSLGVQTFDSKGQRFLGRRHDAKQARQAIGLAVKAGFQSVNIDLLSAWPGQKVVDLKNDLAIAMDLGSDHISCYNLIVERDTELGREAAQGLWREKDDGEAREFWDVTEETLSRGGFLHYEISNFARPGKQCAHNSNCWRGHEYWGLGAAAHSHNDGGRSANATDISAYIESIAKTGSAEVFSERLDPVAKAREGATLWLRMAEGIAMVEFRDRFGVDIEVLYRRELPNLLRQGILEIVDNASGGKNVRLSAEAFPLADSVTVDLV